MSEAILCALIAGGVSLIGTVLTVLLSAQKQSAEMDRKIAVINSQMEDMKEDIKTHNSYAKLFSENIPAIKQHMSDVDRRLDNLERK